MPAAIAVADECMSDAKNRWRLVTRWKRKVTLCGFWGNNACDHGEDVSDPIRLKSRICRYFRNFFRECIKLLVIFRNMSFSEQMSTAADSILPLSPRMEALLNDAVQQTGRSREEILHFCLKHGIERILAEAENNDSLWSRASSARRSRSSEWVGDEAERRDGGSVFSKLFVTKDLVSRFFHFFSCLCYWNSYVRRVNGPSPTSELHPLTVSEEVERLLNEAAEKTGKAQEEILQFCLEHGIHKILEGAASGDSNWEPQTEWSGVRRLIFHNMETDKGFLYGESQMIV